MKGLLPRLLTRVVDFAGASPWWVLTSAILLLAGTWTYASRLDLRSDILELLPRDSAAFRAYERQRSRVAGESNLIVVVESESRSRNELFVNELTRRLHALDASAKACRARCGADASCGSMCEPDAIGFIESDTKDLRQFFEKNKWLYASDADLDSIDQELDDRIQRASGLGPDDDEEPVKRAAANAAPKFAEMRGKAQSRISRFDQFPSGYFATADGTKMGLRIVAKTGGIGDRAGDRLLERVTQIAEAVKAEQSSPGLQVGYAGDIPNVAAEKASITSEARGAVLLVLGLVLVALLVYFRSVWALPVIILPAALGVGSAYAFAMWRFGYLNSTGAFLGAIILGNGINYPIVLLSRYKEFRARGVPPDLARRQAVLSAFRAELVGAVVASIAYGSLTITEFRGFSQFGAIGFVGMLLVWLTMIPVVPALIVLSERLQTRLPTVLRDRVPRLLADGSRSVVTRALAWVTHRLRYPILLAALVATGWVATHVPKFLADPWEYDFDKLGSRQSKQNGGVGAWSTKADEVFGGKMNIAGALMLADSREQVAAVKAAIFERDAQDPQGRLVSEVVTIDDYLPGTASEQERKLKLLASIRKKITPRVLAELSPADRKEVEELRPPESLRAVVADELPALVRRRFEEANGALGALFYVRYWDHVRKGDVSFSDGRTVLRMAKTTDNVVLKDGHVVQTASRSTIFAEMIRSLERDGPRVSLVSFIAVVCVVIAATRSVRGALAVILALVVGVVWLVGGASRFGVHLNFLNFVALPITFGIGSEYPFNIYDRARLLGGDVKGAVQRVSGAVLLCSFTTTVGYGSLLVADNQALQSFGLLALSGEVACVLAAVLVLPALLHVILRTKPCGDGDLQPLA
jgi:predicted RND superfamily exporter protein